MKKSFLLFSCALLTSQLLMAQFESFDLKTYKLPDIKRKQLDIRLNLNGSVLNDNWKYENQDDFYGKTTNFSGNTNAAYYGYKNTERLQSSQRLLMAFAPSFQKVRGSAEETRKISSMNSVINASSVNRIYYLNKYFIEPDVIVMSALNYYKNISDIHDDHENSQTLNLSVPLKAGKGRIEPVQDARLAIYILDELNKNGSLARIPDENEILQFAALISRLKNERFFDSRIKKITEIEKVDSFLQAEGMAVAPNVRYFTTLADNWDNASGPMRESGNRFSLGVVPTLYFNNNFEKNITGTGTQKYHRKSFNTGIAFEADYISAKPLNLKWQRIWKAEIGFAVEKDIFNRISDDLKSESNIKAIESSINYELGYFPNSRTSISGSASCFFNRTISDSDDANSNSNKRVNVTPRINLAINYYISSQLRFALFYESYYYFIHENERWYPDQEYLYNKSYGLNQQLNASLTYSIF